MLRVLLHLVRRPPIRFGLRGDRRGRFRDPRFVSFLSESNRPTLGSSDLHDAVLRSRRVMKHLFRLALFGGAAWVALESARALSVF